MVLYVHYLSQEHASASSVLVRGGLSFDLVRAHEVFGIAKAVADRFYSTPQHAYATKAVSSGACYISVEARKWFQDGHGDDGPGYRTLLLKYLDCVHKTGYTITCLCPVTAYLQLIIRNTPMEDWAVAATDPPDASPLAFAWAWARTRMRARTRAPARVRVWARTRVGARPCGYAYTRTGAHADARVCVCACAQACTCGARLRASSHHVIFILFSPNFNCHRGLAG